jgi:hypothetical protein
MKAISREGVSQRVGMNRLTVPTLSRARLRVEMLVRGEQSGLAPKRQTGHAFCYQYSASMRRRRRSSIACLL